jgi:hypothetical protein
MSRKRNRRKIESTTTGGAEPELELGATESVAAAEGATPDTEAPAAAEKPRTGSAAPDTPAQTMRATRRRSLPPKRRRSRLRARSAT